ncbi:WD_REPEATS_REGION domain-containing protein [Psidium guajava]|nr:WD_REPEATS_REGION domain-containing protein [Psidium guajava]
MNKFHSTLKSLTKRRRTLSSRFIGQRKLTSPIGCIWRGRDTGLRVRRRHEDFREARVPAANCTPQFWASFPGCDHLRCPQVHQEQPGSAFEGTAPGPRRLSQIRPPTPLNKSISSDPTFDIRLPEGSSMQGSRLNPFSAT